MATLVRRDKGRRILIPAPLLRDFPSKTTAEQRALPERDATSLALAGVVALTAFGEWSRALLDKPLTCQLRHKSAGFSLQVGVN